MELKKYDSRVPPLAGIIKREEMQAAPKAIQEARKRILSSKDGAVYVDGFRYVWLDEQQWRATCEIH